MTWVKLDDGFFRHPKARAAGPDGRALFLAGLCWAAENLTDGHIPAACLPIVLADAEVKRTAVQKLLDVGWWEPNGDGWVIHDFLEFNKSRARVEKDREEWKARQRKARGGDS